MEEQNEKEKDYTVEQISFHDKKEVNCNIFHIIIAVAVFLVVMVIIWMFLKNSGLLGYSENITPIPTPTPILFAQ